LIHNEPNKIRWGYSPSGDFNVKEAVKLPVEYNNIPKDAKWRKMWKLKLWPKVASFL